VVVIAQFNVAVDSE